MRKNKHQVNLLFEIMDSNKDGKIHLHDLQRTALIIEHDKHHDTKKYEEMIRKISSNPNGKYISQNDFL